VAKLLNSDGLGKFYGSTVCGTPLYMAPEVLRGLLVYRNQVIPTKAHYEPSADIWSLGCIMGFVCLRAQSHLFEGAQSFKEVNDWKGLALDKQAVKAKLLRTYSKDLVDLIEKMLNSNRKVRPTARELEEETDQNGRQEEP